MTARLLTPRWVLATLVVLAGVSGMVRLGFWQLERLEQRREFNRRVSEQLSAPPLDLTLELPPADQLYTMEYRTVTVTGRYLADQEVLLRNQVWEGQLGYHLLTPLQIEGENAAVIVDRGWIPYEAAEPSAREQYAVSEPVTVTGMLRRQQTESRFGVADPTLTPGESRLDVWNRINIDRLQEQSTVSLLPVYVQQAPEPGDTTPPIPSLPEIELSEGSHFGYALQWFAFATVLAIGYPVFLYRKFNGGRVRGSGHEQIERKSV